MQLIGKDVPYTEENQNFFRLCALLFEEGPRAIRNAINKEVEKRYCNSIKALLSDHDIIHGLKCLLKRERLTLEQAQQLYPCGFPDDESTKFLTAVNTESFDIPLLSLLYEVMSTVHKVPKVYLSAVHRIRDFRTNIYGHINKARLTQDDFNEYWKNLRLDLRTLCVPEPDIERWKHHPLSPGEIAGYHLKIRELLDRDTVRQLSEKVKCELRKIDELVERSRDNDERIPEHIHQAIHDYFPDISHDTFKELAENVGEHFGKQLHYNLEELRKLTKYLQDNVSDLYDAQNTKQDICNQLQTNLDEIKTLKSNFEASASKVVESVERRKLEMNQVEIKLILN